MHCYLSNRQSEHQPSFFLVRGQVQSTPESSKRADVMHVALAASGHHTLNAGDEISPDDDLAIQRVHDERYLEFLQTAWARWQALPGSTKEVVPNIHPGRNTRYDGVAPHCQSPHIVAQAGYYQHDTACPITEGTWQAARSAVGAALSVGRRISSHSERRAYALCRPPGHHAYADQAGGFCYLNNSAITAQHFVDAGANRVAVIDVDVHHGNGTQGIFYTRADVFTVSLHGDPAMSYPFFAGFSAEVGVGEGDRRNLNVPLPAQTGDEDYLTALNNALKKVEEYSPDAVVVALGLDAYGEDPLAFLNLSTDGFGRVGERLGKLGLPTALIQEGGYLSEALGQNLVAFLGGFESSHGAQTI